MAHVLLVNPSSLHAYGNAKAAVSVPAHPPLGLLMVAGEALRRGHRVTVLDLSGTAYDAREVAAVFRRTRPDVVGLTVTTPLANQARDVSLLVKELASSVPVVAGGPHVSALPVATLAESHLDAVVVGEGERTFGELLDGRPLTDIAGLVYRDATSGAIVRNPPRPFLDDLDALPLPAWHLVDAAAYGRRTSRLLARRPPLAMVEFSRGCVYRCEFCASKLTLGHGLRKKSPERCVEELRAARAAGYREVALADDLFTTDARWAAAVADAVGRARTGLLWSCTNGIRVESADEGLFRRMARAGCYRVSFGLESGDDAVLRASGKGGRASVAAARAAVASARAAGMETAGFFLLGLTADTEASMRATVALARALPLDVLKFGLTVPFPGTPMFRALRAGGLLRTYDWDEYTIYTTRLPFRHPQLSDEALQRALTTAYREAILANPAFALRRLRRGLLTGELVYDAYYLARFLLSPAASRPAPVRYHARDRWPTYDHAAATDEESPT